MKMVKLLMTTLLASCFFAGSAQTPVTDYKPVSPDRATWVRRSSEYFTKQASRFRTRAILFLGDSITSQWLRPAKDPYPGGLQAWKKHFAKNSLNFGISGDRIEHILWRITEGKQLDGCKFRVIVLMIGANNIVASKKEPQSLEKIVHGNDQIIQIIRKKQPWAKILLLSIIPLRFDGGVRDKMADEIDPLLRKLADNKNVFYLDVAKIFRDKNGKKILLRDGVHPAPEGYDKMAELIKPEVDKLLGLTQPGKAAPAKSGKK